MKMKNIFFQNLELKHFAHIALPVGFKQGICPQFNTITVYGIGNGSSTQHHTGDLSLEMNGIIQCFRRNQDGFRADCDKVTV